MSLLGKLETLQDESNWETGKLETLQDESTWETRNPSG